MHTTPVPTPMKPSTTQPEPDVQSLAQAEAQRTQEHYLRQVERVAASLHRVAEDLVREATPRRSTHGAFSDAAANAVHSLQWGVANVPMQSLLSAAFAADGAQRDLVTTA